MKNFSKLIAAFVMLVGLGACQHKYPTCLVEVDSLLYKNPQAAYAQLKVAEQNISPSQLEDYNYCCLLKMMAGDRTYQSVKNLAALGKIVHYFENKHEMDKLAKAYYLQGRFFQESHEYSIALSYYHKALKVLDDKEDLDLRGLAYSQIGNILMDFDIFPEAKCYYGKAISCDSLQKDTEGIAFGIRDLAVVDMEQGDLKGALGKFQRALSLARACKQESLVRDIQLQLAGAYLYGTNNLDSVWFYLSPSFHHVDGKMKSHAYLIASEYYWSRGKEDSAKVYLSQVAMHGDIFQKCEACKRLVTIFSYEDDLPFMQRYTEKYLLLNDSISLLKEKEHKMRGQDIMKFLTQEDEIKQLKQSNDHKLYLSLSVLFMLFVVVVAFFCYYQMGVMKKIKIRKRLAKIKLLMFSSEERQKARCQEICEKLQFDTYIKLQKCLPIQAWKQLEDEVDRLFPKFKDKVTSCFEVSDFEYQICMLVKIGVSSSQMAILTAHAVTSISMAKQRLFFKLTGQKGKAEDLNQFLMFI